MQEECNWRPITSSKDSKLLSTLEPASLLPWFGQCFLLQVYLLKSKLTENSVQKRNKEVPALHLTVFSGWLPWVNKVPKAEGD